jgi:hypothetical protein
MTLKNPICTTLLICILLVLFIILIILVANYIFKIPLLLEGFYAKRNDRIRIYQSDENYDPDEAPEIEDLDPDDYSLFDPDQQPLLDNQMNIVLRNFTRGV